MVFNTAPYNSVPLNSGTAVRRTVDIVAPVTISRVAATVDIAAGVTISRVAATVDIVAPVTIRRLGTVDIVAPVTIVRSDIDYVRSWDALVTLGGVDVTARVLGKIKIESERDCARIAEFSLRPVAGTFNPISYSGPAVTIDILVGGLTFRRFTGRADKPTIDPVTGIVGLRCHDDRANVLAALPIATLDALIPGRYSAALDGAIDDHYEYALARMESVKGSLDLDAWGAPRVSMWQGGALTGTINLHLDEQVKVELPERANIRNKIVITLQYRYTRLRDRRAVIGWSAPSQWSYTMQALGWQYPSQATLASAAEGGGDWQVTRHVFMPAPRTVSVDITFQETVKVDGVDTIQNVTRTCYMDIDADKCSAYLAYVGQRHAQTITETHTLTVLAPTSIAANGELVEELSGTLETAWDGSAWETDLTAEPALFGGEIDWAPDVPRSAMAATVPEVGSLADGPWSSSTTTVEDCAGTAQVLTVTDTFDNFAETALAKAEVKIAASHNSGRAIFSEPWMPELGIHQDWALVTPSTNYKGQIHKLVEEFDFDTTSATSEVALAISSAGGVGIVDPSMLTAPAKPADAIPVQPWESELPGLATWVGGVVAYTDALTGWLANCPESYQMYIIDPVSGAREYRTVDSLGYTPDGLPVTGFRVNMPEITPCNVNAVNLTAAKTYTVEVAEDLFETTIL